MTLPGCSCPHRLFALVLVGLLLHLQQLQLIRGHGRGVTPLHKGLKNLLQVPPPQCLTHPPEHPLD